MKKVLKTLGFVIGLPLLYMFISTLVSGVYVGVYYIINQVGPDTFNILEILTPVIYHLTIISDLITFIIIFFIFLGLKKNLFKVCRFNKVNLKVLFYMIVFSIGLSMLILFSMLILTPLFPNIFEGYSLVQKSLLLTHNSILSLIIVIVLIPIFEEIFFRGVIFGFLRDNYSIPLALVLQAFIFAICHYNLIQGIYAFILGLFLGIFFYVTNSLYASLVANITYKFFGVFVIPLIISYLQSAPLMVMNILFIIVSVVLLILGSHKLIKSFQKDSSLYY